MQDSTLLVFSFVPEEDASIDSEQTVIQVHSSIQANNVVLPSTNDGNRERILR